MQYQVAFGPFDPPASVKGGIGGGFKFRASGASWGGVEVVGAVGTGAGVAGVGATAVDRPKGSSLDPYKSKSHK